MNQENNFIDDLLAEAEAGEQKLLQSHMDLILLEITKLKKQIAYNFHETEKEIEILNRWTLQKNSKLQDRISFYERKLEVYIREENQKTIDLAHGILKIRKMPDKVEINDIELFLANASSELLTIVPETWKADLTKIKSFIKNHGQIPKGVIIIPGKDEFKLKLKTKENNYDNQT